MPEDPKKPKWLTVRGKHVEVKPGEDIESVIRDETKKSEYVQRYGCVKKFDISDKVTFDKYNKTGEVYGYSGNFIKVFGDDGISYSISDQSLFKTDEVSGFGHWDTMNSLDRRQLLKNCGVGLECQDRNWHQLNPAVQTMLIKNITAPGYESGGNSSMPGTFNPVSTDKSIAEKVKDDIKEQKNEKKKG